jgi:hypothetical protein
LNFRLAEIGILLIPAYYILALFVAPSLWSLGATTTYSISCTVIGIGLILLVLDEKGFMRRMKGNNAVSVLLMVFGLFLIMGALFFLVVASAVESYYATKIPGRYPQTFEESLTGLLFFSSDILSFFLGVVWFAYGLAILDLTLFPPSKQEIALEPQIRYTKDLFAKYVERYPHNPRGVLEWHIHKKMKQGKTSEQVIKELEEEITKKQISSGDAF